MKDLIIIELNKLRFFSYHGLYAEEKKTGGEFEINLTVCFSPSDKITALDETVNYEKLYQIIKSEMQKPRDLMETLVMEMTQAIHLSFSLIKKVEITINKLQIPLAGFTGNAGVRYVKEY